MKKKLTRVIRKHGRWYIAYIREIPGMTVVKSSPYFSKYSCKNFTVA